MTTSAVAQAAKNLTRFSGTELECRCALGLKAGDSTAQFKHSLHVAHLLTLVDEVFQPAVRRFNLAGHVCKLESNDWVVNEPLAKGLALVRVLHRLLVADAREANALDNDTNTLMVEVSHDDLEALVLFANEIFHWDFDIFESNVCGAATPYTLAVHLTGRDAPKTALDEQHGDTPRTWSTSPDSRGEVITPDAIGDPLLLTIDNVVFTIFRKLGFTCQIRDVASRIC